MVTSFEKQKTVKAFEADITFINERAKSLGCTAAEVIQLMCKQLRKAVYLQDLGDAFDTLRSDSDKWKEFESEQAVWDCTLSDGLENAP